MATNAVRSRFFAPPRPGGWDPHRSVVLCRDLTNREEAIRLPTPVLGPAPTEFLSRSIDLYFATEERHSRQWTMELREMENGVITRHSPAFGRPASRIRRKKIVVSRFVNDQPDDGTDATTFSLSLPRSISEEIPSTLSSSSRRATIRII